MLTRRYSGAWATKRTTPIPVVALKPFPDPQHYAPDPNIEPVGDSPLWVADSQAAPGLSGWMIAPPYETGRVPQGGGPIDNTPETHAFGVGGGPGQDTITAQQVRTEWMSADYGATLARQWKPLTDRDGTGPHVAIIPDMVGDGASPETLRYESSGFGDPTDPFARLAMRIKRWWDRPIDMHRYEVERRPWTGRKAYTAGYQPPVADRRQFNSPYETSATYYSGSPNRFLRPQTRRVPEAWVQPRNLDQSAEIDASVMSAQLLPSWGL